MNSFFNNKVMKESLDSELKNEFSKNDGIRFSNLKLTQNLQGKSLDFLNSIHFIFFKLNGLFWQSPYFKSLKYQLLYLNWNFGKESLEKIGGLDSFVGQEQGKKILQRMKIALQIWINLHTGCQTKNSIDTKEEIGKRGKERKKRN